MKFDAAGFRLGLLIIILGCLNFSYGGERTVRRFECPTPRPTPTPCLTDLEQKQWQDYTAALMDKLQRHLEEWGVVTVSDPLVVPAGDDFDLGTDFLSAGKYIDAESGLISASAGQFSQEVGQFQFSGNEQLGVAGAGNATKGAGGTNGTQSGNSGSTGNTQDTGAGLPKANSKDYLAQQTFAAPGSLIAKTTAISERSAVNNGIGDKLTERALRLQANPSKLKDGWKRYFFVFQVTCNPGWRTLQGYMADLQVQFEYGAESSGGWTLSITETRSQPHIIAALPLMDAQNIETRNSERQLAAISAALSAAGPNALGSASGKALIDYIKSYQSDAASRLAMPVVNSYTSGTTFGLRFSPSFLALGDPAKKHSGSQNRLIPTAFPVVLLMAIDPIDVHTAKVKYTHLVTHVSYHWMLRDHDFSLWPWRQPKRREDEAARIQLARDVDAVSESFNLWGNALTKQEKLTSLAFTTFREDYFQLEQKCLGRVSYDLLPKGLFGWTGPRAYITDVFPETIDPDVDTAVVIRGNFGYD